MKINMMLGLALISLISFGCGGPPHIPVEKKTVEVKEDTVLVDTVELDYSEPVVIKIHGDTIDIKSASINTTYIVAVEDLKIKMYNNELTSILLNGEVQLLELRSKYKYLNANELVIQKGQTLTQIVKDHRIILNDPNLTVEKIKNINNLKTNTINSGAILKLY